MALESADKSFVRKLVFFSSLGATVAAVVGIVSGVSWIDNHLPEKVTEFQHENRNPSGDTPVVLVGGSLDFRASGGWQPAAPPSYGTQYSTTPATPITMIALKSHNMQPDEGDPSTDLMDVGISSTTNWTVDEYAKKSGGPEFLAVSVRLQGSNINVSTTNGYLCLTTTTKLVYDQTHDQANDCPDRGKFKITRVAINVTDRVSNSQASGNFNCVDADNNPGYCKIAFRSKLQ
jgi:hypothetical protein